jgi:tripartite-type tricarboxylate transporter receptor subunit TctC
MPTFAEAGLPGFEVTTWTGLCAPSGTPRAIVDKLADDVGNALVAPEVRQQLLEAGVEPRATTPAWLAEHIAAEVAKYNRIVAAANIVVEE